MKTNSPPPHPSEPTAAELAASIRVRVADLNAAEAKLDSATAAGLKAGEQLGDEVERRFRGARNTSQDPNDLYRWALSLARGKAIPTIERARELFAESGRKIAQAKKEYESADAQLRMLIQYRIAELRERLMREANKQRALAAIAARPFCADDAEAARFAEKCGTVRAAEDRAEGMKLGAGTLASRAEAFARDLDAEAKQAA